MLIIRSVLRNDPYSALMWLLCALLFSGVYCQSAVANVQINDVRIWSAPTHTRVVFDISAAVEYKVFVLSNPARVVIDFSDVQLKNRLPAIAKAARLLKHLRSAEHQGDVLRVVLGLKFTVRPKSFILLPNGDYGHRLVVDLIPADSTATRQPLPPPKLSGQPHDIVVAIDAGHGGEDPGAISINGDYEKVIVLKIAKHLAVAVNKTPGIKAVLIRDGDYYIGLRQRIEKARQHKADLFISIHADSARNRKVRGAGVYVLSFKGVSSEQARRLANKENAADQIGGVRLDDTSPYLATMLLDMSQTVTAKYSELLGTRVLISLNSRLSKVHKKHIERADFVVLKSPDIPSILVETGFLSNRKDAARLSETKNQRIVAEAILVGILDFLPTLRLAKEQ